MFNVWLYSLGSVFLVSLISILAIFGLVIKIEKHRSYLLFMVSFAAGALLGDAFIHLIPEILKTSSNPELVSLKVLIGIFLFFILEKIICWRHCHIPTSAKHPHVLGIMNLVGDGMHNFLDGMIIASAFLTNSSLGFATVLAIIFHEIPQEIGDFSILIYAGYSKGRAVIYNFLSALSAVLGTIFILILGSQNISLIENILPIAAGGFIYIAASDLIPELKKEHTTISSIWQLLFLLLGVMIMWWLKQRFQ